MGHLSLSTNLEHFTRTTNLTLSNMAKGSSYPGLLAISNVILLVASAVVYCVSFHSVLMSRRLKHALVNLWAASSSLVFLYIAGIYQTEDVATCQAVGISAHYLTLSSLVWLTISVSVIYQKANRARIRQSNGGNIPAPAFLDRQRRH